LSAAGVIVVDDSYNANPASMQAAIAAFCQRDSRRKIAVLGEMRELGDESAAAHKTLLTQLGGFDEVILVGSAMLHLAVSEGLFDQQTTASAAEQGSGLVHNNLHFYAEASELLLKDLTGLIHAEDALLIKGSNRVFWARDFVSKLLKAIAKKL
jgi:UDP-N-acetylmuramoyl-tripeptide--D-alanyl-D-alanine ligase